MSLPRDPRQDPRPGDVIRDVSSRLRVVEIGEGWVDCWREDDRGRRIHPSGWMLATWRSRFATAQIVEVADAA